MTKIIRCPCGTVVRARDDESLVAQAQQHAREVHQMELTREQALAMAGPE
jgi:predicted small metal-binding protein